MSNPIADLAAFFQAAFTAAELRDFLLASQGKPFVDGLPDPAIGAAIYAFRAAERMFQWGFTARFFQDLANARPRHYDAICVLARAVGQAVPAKPAEEVPKPYPDPEVFTKIDPDPAPKPAAMEPVILTIRLDADRARSTWRSNNQTLSSESPIEPFDVVIEELARAAYTNPSNRAAMKSLGDALTGRILAGGLSNHFTSAAGEAIAKKRPLRVQIDFADRTRWPELPWELVREKDQPFRFLSMRPEIQLVRRLLHSAVVYRPAAERQRILILAACANGRPIAVDKEAEEIGKLWTAKGHDVDTLLEPNRREIRNVLFDRESYDVVHVASHGSPGTLYLGETLDAETISALFTGRVSTAFVVNACQGAQPDWATDSGGEGGRNARPPAPEPTPVDLEGSMWSGVAAGLASVGVPHTVAYTSKVRDDDALDVARFWHRSYLKDGDPVIATSQARRSMIDSDTHAFGFLVQFSIGLD